MASATTTDPRPAAVVERSGWALAVLWAVGWLTVAGCVVGTVLGVVDLVTWLQPGTPVPVTLDGGAELAGPTGHDFYSGAPFIADGVGVSATQVRAVVSGLSPATRAMLALAPLAWTVTIGVVAACIARAARALRLHRRVQPLVVRLLRVAALVLAVGGTTAQVLRGVADLQLGSVSWNSPALGDHGSINGGGFSIGLAPLLGAIGLLAVATVLARGVPADPSDP